MLKKIKNLDFFTRNIILVFAGSSLANFLNLLYQLLIAHKLSPSDFAAFNSLVAIFLLVATPLGTLQLAVVKYISEFNAKGENERVRALIFKILKSASALAVATLLFFAILTPAIIRNLKVDSSAAGYLLALILSLAWITPVFTGVVQGIESFRWLMAGSVASGISKLILAFIFIISGFGIAGALGALLASNLILTIAYVIPSKSLLKRAAAGSSVGLKELIFYALPIAIATICYNWLTTFDMVLVRVFFTPSDSGAYSLAQMVGKIFLFLPGAISIVLFPRASRLKATQNDTRHILKRSLFYGVLLSISACLVYNLFPELVLKALTGKTLPESISLGRLFSISMTFYALLFIPINYFLSIKEFGFIKYLAIFSVLQFCAIALFHNNLFQVQAILCVNSLALLAVHIWLALRHNHEKP